MIYVNSQFHKTILTQRKILNIITNLNTLFELLVFYNKISLLTLYQRLYKVKCPKCKTEVQSTDVFCPNCNLRLVIECPKCKSKVRLGSASCKECGYVFVKFCPRCNSANYVSSPTCRKCFYVFEEIKEDVQTKDKKDEPLILKQENKKSPDDGVKKPMASYLADNRLEVLIDFMNLLPLFKKFKDEEFKSKVLLNITTSIKVAFGATSEFYKENIARFKLSYNKNNGISGKIEKFNAEMTKFNTFLNETLNAEITHKFVILGAGEIELDKPVMQLAIGRDKDIVTSRAAYDILHEEIPLVKISPDSYKMANLEKENPKTGEIKETDEAAALETVYQAIVQDNNIKGISINAPRGTGKTHVLGLLYQKLANSDIAILASRCSALTQVAPLGLFQDAFLNLFNLPFAPADYEETTGNLRSLIKNYLPDSFAKEKIETLINVVYPRKEAFYEEIETNKETTFSHIKDILEAMRFNARVLLTIDDFDLIDEMSFEFLKYLIQNNFFVDGSKFLICYRNRNTLNMYIPPEILKSGNCLDINLKKREIGSTRAFIKNHIGDVSVLPRKISDQIIMNAKGDLAYTGQVLFHLIETKKIKLTGGKFTYSKSEEEYFVPQNMADITAERLQFLSKKSKTEFVVLNLASFLGGKFTKSVIADVIDTDEEEFDGIIKSLESSGYITKIDDETYIFKNSLVWTNIYIFARNNREMKPYVEALLKVLLARTISSPAVCALLAQIAGNKPAAFTLWTKNLKIASAVGDAALYIMSQKQSLVNLEGISLPDEYYIRNNIYERLGKLTYKKSPYQAIDYLSNAVVEAKNQDNTGKIIELSGYLTESCKLAQKYPAVIETVDNVLSVFENKSKSGVQKALIKTRKLEALLAVGNYEEVINIVNTEINPVLSDILRQKKKFSFISKEDLYKSWIKANIVLIEAYAYQGNPVAFELVDVVEKEVYKDSKNVDDELNKKLKLACALSYTMKGIFGQSDEILHSLIKDFSNSSREDSPYISKWNMITLFNKILRLDFENIKEDLFEAVTYANNTGDDYTKNILKTVLALVILEEDNDALRPLEICQEQMNYFSNEKIALGALIAWYISARATLKISGPDKAIEICEKSIQISESTKINSVWFKILFRMLLAKCYILKDDLESAGMYTELASQDVNLNELNYFMLHIVRLRAAIMQDSIDKVAEDKKTELANRTVKTYEKALSLSGKLNLDKFTAKIQKDLTSFKASCQLKRITLQE